MPIDGARPRQLAVGRGACLFKADALMLGMQRPSASLDRDSTGRGAFRLLVETSGDVAGEQEPDDPNQQLDVFEPLTGLPVLLRAGSPVVRRTVVRPGRRISYRASTGQALAQRKEPLSIDANNDVEGAEPGCCQVRLERKIGKSTWRHRKAR